MIGVCVETTLENFLFQDRNVLALVLKIFDGYPALIVRHTVRIKKCILAVFAYRPVAEESNRP